MRTATLPSAAYRGRIAPRAGFAWTPHVKAGKIKALGTIGARRFAGLPDAPSFSELGYDLDFRGWVGLFAPANTPREVITRLNAEINRVIGLPEVRERFSQSGIEIVGGAPETFERHIREQVGTWGKVVKDANIRAD